MHFSYGTVPTLRLTFHLNYVTVIATMEYSDISMVLEKN